MNVFDPSIGAQLDAGRIDRRQAVLLNFDEGSFGFFAGGPGTLVWNGINYVGAGGLITVQLGQEDVSQTQESVEISISSKYEVNGQSMELISVGVLQGIEAMTYLRRPATVGKFYISPAGQIIDFVPDMLCEMHGIYHEEDDKNGYVLRGVLNNIGSFRAQVDSLARNSDLQAQIDATDNALNMLSISVVEKIYWGSKPPAPVQKRKSLF